MEIPHVGGGKGKDHHVLGFLPVTFFDMTDVPGGAHDKCGDRTPREPHLLIRNTSRPYGCAKRI